MNNKKNGNHILGLKIASSKVENECYQKPINVFERDKIKMKDNVYSEEGNLPKAAYIVKRYFNIFGS